jgi:uncharacterized protein with HEPN domain/predicted nucleotidyltransferase
MSDLQKLTVDDLLKDKREAILKLMEEYGADNARVFGSTARGEADETSDIDFLVDFAQEYTIWNHIGLAQALENLLGRKVDVAVAATLDERLRPNILRDAVPLNLYGQTEIPGGGFVKDQKIYLQDILERIGYIEEDTAAGKDAFLQSRIIRDAVIRNFEVIGEAVKRLSDELTGAYPHIEWHQIAGFRDFLIHHYNRVDPQEVWKIVENDLQPLRQAVESMLQKLSAPADES